MQVIGGLKLLGTDDVHLIDTHVKFKGSVGISGSMKTGYVDRFTMEDSLISGFDDKPCEVGVYDSPYNENWGMRAYNLRDALIQDTEIRNIEKEHGLYYSRAGDMRIQRCYFHDIGSQGIQDAQRECDLIGGRADNVSCLLEILQCKFERCATLFGRRQSWNLSIFAFDENLRQWYPDGPLILNSAGNPQKGHMVRSLTDVVIAGCEFEGSGYEHLASGSRDCNSTGAILVQDRFNLDIVRCKFNYVRPDRAVIQVRNVENFSMGPCEMNGGDLTLHNMDNCHVDIKPGTGDGWIRKQDLGSHTSKKICPITSGYSH